MLPKYFLEILNDGLNLLTSQIPFEAHRIILDDRADQGGQTVLRDEDLEVATNAESDRHLCEVHARAGQGSAFLSFYWFESAVDNT